jgi:hypothetical protein
MPLIPIVKTSLFCATIVGKSLWSLARGCKQASTLKVDIGGKMQNAVIFDTLWRKFSPHYTELPVQLERFRAGSREFPHDERAISEPPALPLSQLRQQLPRFCIPKSGVLHFATNINLRKSRSSVIENMVTIELVEA